MFEIKAGITGGMKHLRLFCLCFGKSNNFFDLLMLFREAYDVGFGLLRIEFGKNREFHPCGFRCWQGVRIKVLWWKWEWIWKEDIKCNP